MPVCSYPMVPDEIVQYVVCPSVASLYPYSVYIPWWCHRQGIVCIQGWGQTNPAVTKVPRNSPKSDTKGL